ncbi:MAG: FAD-dependent oxidoreductase [Rhodospirillales bacterium]|jgi:NADPH-dependent 2,4-dienoyl-CoA reductase/sulfur reductase-like enzyme|nr:FAD-dependent oxidoreductase [Rhodospirillales bacterium]
MNADAPVVIIGAGPAGATAALALAEAGISSVLLDDNGDAGGQVWRTGAADQGPPLAYTDARGDELRRDLARHGDIIDHRTGHEVVGLFPDLRLWVLAGGETVTSLHPKAVIVATGALEVFAPVPGWTRPGVYGLGGLQALMKTSRAVPDGPVVLGGAGPLLRLVAAQLAALGAEISAVVDAAPWPSPGQVWRLASQPGLLAKGVAFEWGLLRRGIPIHRGSAIVEIAGDDEPDSVLVAPVDETWKPVEGPRRRLAARVVGLGYGVRSNVELTRLAGCEHVFSAPRGGWHATRDPNMETTVENLFLAGDGGGIGGVEVALAEGVIAASAVAQRLGRGDGLKTKAAKARRRLVDLTRFQDALAEWSGVRPGILAGCTEDTIVCRCEDVKRGEIAAAVAAGYTDIGPVKMNTRAGMGLCQGRTCTPAVQAIMASETGTPLAEVGLPTSRAPLRPVPLEALAQLPQDEAAE